MTTKILSFYLLLGSPLFPSALAFEKPEHWGASQVPLEGYQENGPVLYSIRVEPLPKVLDLGRFPEDSTKLNQLCPVEVFKSQSLAFTAWLPFEKNDLKMMESCDTLPCDLKLNGSEVKKMRAVSEPERKTQFLRLVTERVLNYAQTGNRIEYEFAGDPVDPWKAILALNLFPEYIKAPVQIPDSSLQSLRVQKINFAPERLKPLRQVLDCRVMPVQQNLAGQSVDQVIWIRDAYMAHYFDSWGELYWVHRNLKKKEAWWAGVLLVELDLLKKNDLISIVGRPSMKNAFKESAQLYLKGQFERIYPK